jgi:hypothetical protein
VIIEIEGDLLLTDQTPISPLSHRLDPFEVARQAGYPGISASNGSCPVGYRNTVNHWRLAPGYNASCHRGRENTPDLATAFYKGLGTFFVKFNSK